MAKQSDLIQYDAQTERLKKSVEHAERYVKRDEAELVKSKEYLASCQKRLAKHVANPPALTPKQAAKRKKY